MDLATFFWDRARTGTSGVIKFMSFLVSSLNQKELLYF